MVKEECRDLLDALNRATACYRHLVLTLGGTSDSPSLREELRRTRRRAQQLAAANRSRLTVLLRERGAGREERAELERLWVLFATCLDALEADMRRALELGRRFPLRAAATPPLLRTGMSGATAALAARAAGPNAAEPEEGGEEEEEEIGRLEEMVRQMETQVNVPRWTVEARQDPGAELKSTPSRGASSSLGVIAAARESKPCDLSKLLAGSVFTAVLIVAIVLAVCVVKLS
ncbi:regulator of G-protein signaling 9-binding protein [Rhinatrema bivittatum]|uniref:regulator of G-protein signaling 9-binding protein n=1 Tax=Rhinatrema bivittatum TaxID=194408 RepID=UPI00112B3A3F|nr:regulator of G-protein signaling 9-binding protein [Rhinatrema bivittatum]